MSVNSPSQGWPASRIAATHRPTSYFRTSVAGWSAGKHAVDGCVDRVAREGDQVPAGPQGDLVRAPVGITSKSWSPVTLRCRQRPSAVYSIVWVPKADSRYPALGRTTTLLSRTCGPLQHVLVVHREGRQISTLRVGVELGPRPNSCLSVMELALFAGFAVTGGSSSVDRYGLPQGLCSLSPRENFSSINGDECYPS